jgi:hypothetical protein
MKRPKYWCDVVITASPWVDPGCTVLSQLEFIFMTCQDQSRFCEKPSQNHIWDKRVAKNHTKTIDNLVIYRLRLGKTTLFEHFCRKFAVVKRYCAVFFRIARLYHTAALWLTSLTLSDVMHIVERLTTVPSDVIAPVGVTSSWRYRVIAPVGATSSRHLRRHGRTLGLEFLN